MKLLTTLSQWFNKMRDKRQKSLELKHQAKLHCLSCEIINVMEFDGHFYISFDGAPVVRISELKTAPTQLLSEARETYLKWKAKFDK